MMKTCSGTILLGGSSVLLLAAPGTALALPNDSGIDFSGERFWVVILIIVLMAGLFSFLFFWQNRIEQSGYFAKLYRETVKSFEVSRNISPLRTAWLNGRYVEELLQCTSKRAKQWREDDSANTMPSGHDALTAAAELEKSVSFFRGRYRVHDAEMAMERTLYRLVAMGDSVAAPAFEIAAGGSSIGNLFGSAPPPPPPPPVPPYGGDLKPGTGILYPTRSGSGIITKPRHDQDPDSPDELSPELIDKVSQFEISIDEFNTKAREWVARAYACIRDWYSRDLETLKKEAESSADLVMSVDFSAIRGRGPEFVLEFTAIIVIIFAAVMLGVGGVLKDQQIGTLLAAIAGYVLGKSTSRSASPPTGAPAVSGTTDIEGKASSKSSPPHS
jgi:hypothetical protein